MHAALLGQPAAHSRSPLLHAAAYDALGLRDWRYHSIGCGPADLAPLLARVRDSGRWAGLSLTMPLKEVAAGLLDEVRTDLGVVNTVVVDGPRLIGHNTDVAGVRAGLLELGYDGGPVALLGAGGTARAALAAVAGLGGTSVVVHVRAAARAARAVQVGLRAGLAVTVAPLDPVEPGAVVISTLPATAPAGRATGPLLDVVYEPWPTPRARGALAAGLPVAGGLTVLLGQAAGQVELMTGRTAPWAAMRAALV